jgi:hypothetical protein
MPGYHFERESRTPYSESYTIEEDDRVIGRVDLHFSAGVAYATLCVPESLTEDDVQDLIGEIDERLVMTADPYREDFIVTVWAGREAGIYSDEDFEREEAEEDAETNDNGHRFSP